MSKLNPRSKHYLSSLRVSLITFSMMILCAPFQGWAEGATSVFSSAPRLVPDRPSYADATSSVDRGHWHLELGGTWLPQQDASINGLLRYGLGYGWEMRLMSPTALQVFPFESEGGVEVSPDLTLGAAQLGAKWAHHWSRLEFSTVLMIGIPTNSTSVAMSPDPLVSLTTQISHALNQKLSAGLAFKYATLDGLLLGQEVAYAEELGHLFGFVGSITLGEVDWSIFTQAGVELLDSVITPLVGGGFTLRISAHSQLDLSLNAPLTSDGVSARYMGGVTFSW